MKQIPRNRKHITYENLFNKFINIEKESDVFYVIENHNSLFFSIHNFFVYLWYVMWQVKNKIGVEFKYNYNRSTWILSNPYFPLDLTYYNIYQIKNNYYGKTEWNNKRSGDVIMDMFIDSTFPNKRKLNNLGFILNVYFTNEFIKNEDGEDKHILVAKLNKLRNMGWDINPKINDIRIDYETYIDNANKKVTNE